jgi:hypothetical protein
MAHGLGYRKALLDIAEKLNNAAQNGSLTHTYEEIMDQLVMLADENIINVTHDELLASGT